MPRVKVYPPSECYPPSVAFECEVCGAEPGEECDEAALYGRTIYVGGGHQVHLVRARTRADEVLRRVEEWRQQYDHR